MTPQAQAAKQAAISGPLFNTIATRSFRPMPQAFRLASVSPIKARRALKSSAVRPGAEIAGASAAPVASRSFREVGNIGGDPGEGIRSR